MTSGYSTKQRFASYGKTESLVNRVISSLVLTTRLSLGSPYGTNTFINPNQMSHHELLTRGSARSLCLFQSHNLSQSRAYYRPIESKHYEHLIDFSNSFFLPSSLPLSFFLSFFFFLSLSDCATVTSPGLLQSVCGSCCDNGFFYIEYILRLGYISTWVAGFNETLLKYLDGSTNTRAASAAASSAKQLHYLESN